MWPQVERKIELLTEFVQVLFISMFYFTWTFNAYLYVDNRDNDLLTDFTTLSRHNAASNVATQ